MDQDQVIACYFMIFFILLFSIGCTIISTCYFKKDDNEDPLLNDK